IRHQQDGTSDARPVPQRPMTDDVDDDKAASAAAAARRPSASSTRLNTTMPLTKNAMRARIPNRLEPVSMPTNPKTAGPTMPAKRSDTLKNPKNSEDFARGIMVA